MLYSCKSLIFFTVDTHEFTNFFMQACIYIISILINNTHIDAGVGEKVKWNK